MITATRGVLSAAAYEEYLHCLAEADEPAAIEVARGCCGRDRRRPAWRTWPTTSTPPWSRGAAS
ncbi:hypothetical protein [Micromonospora craniellae]|uniref:hypothetical protein n=1 Tax=Micromonospora craniellae TaxID=2294034 RepID=UPI00168A624D|nr:hypothetical protein [Micromonospora craniellae]QOC92454.1 hypothetical protein ID554_01265 [Micromonospora craniellae]